MDPKMTPEQALAMLATMTDQDFPTATPDNDISDDQANRLIDAAHKTAGRPSLTGPGQHSPQVTLRLSRPMNERLDAVATTTHRRRSQVVRDALETYLAAT